MSSLCEKFTDGDWIEAKDQSDSGIRLVQTGNVGVAEYLDKPNNKKWISADTFERLHCQEVFPGDILISRLPEPAGRACIMPFLGTKMITAVDCTIVRTAVNVSNKFLVQYLSSQEYFDEVNTCLAGGTRQRISRGNLANFEVKIPAEKAEQDEIGALFEDIDYLITLHQRKSHKYKRVFSCNAFSWEQRKLCKIAEKVTEKNTDLAIQETFTNSAEFGVISQRDFFDHDISNAENICGYYVVRDGDFVYNPRISVSAPVGPVNCNKLGRNGVMSPLYTVFRTHDIDTTYLAWFFKSNYWHSFMHYNGDSGARSDRFSIKDMVFFEMPIPIPRIEEQRLIGTYLEKLNNLITLHQRKAKYIFIHGKWLRKHCFRGDLTSVWEQRKLGDCFLERTESDPNGELISVTINSGIKKFSELGRHDTSNDDKSKYKKVVIGDIAYNSMRMWQGASGWSSYNGIVSPAYTVITPLNGIYSPFFAYMFKLPTMIHTFQIRSQGITSDTWNLKFPALKEIEVRYPSDEREQKSIAECLTRIDNLITLHQRKQLLNLVKGDIFYGF